MKDYVGLNFVGFGFGFGNFEHGFVEVLEDKAFGRRYQMGW